MKYTKEYLHLLQEAINRAPDFGITRKTLINTKKISQSEIDKACNLLNAHWNAIVLSIPGYLGNRCIALVSKMFSILASNEIDADIVIGNVIYNGESLYPCSIESLMKEVQNPGGEGDRISLHAWVTIGGDTIWDGALFSMLVASKAADQNFDKQFMFSRAGIFAERSNLLYEPIVVGSQFIALINEIDPWIEMEARKHPKTRPTAKG